jgi:fluoroquinolone transport system permease protein
MLDATMMAVMYVGAVMYFEKNESTISTLLVTPITNSELILSKVVSYTLHNLLSAVLLIVVFVIIRDVQMNYILILIGIVLTTGFFTTAGVVLSYFQKDFTTMLVQIMMLAFALFIPQLLVEFNVLKGDFWEIIMYINPIQVASNLIGYAFDGNIISNFDYFYSLGFIIIGGVLLYRFLALPKFQEYAVKQSGV